MLCCIYTFSLNLEGCNLNYLENAMVDLRFFSLAIFLWGGGKKGADGEAVF